MSRVRAPLPALENSGSRERLEDEERRPFRVDRAGFFTHSVTDATYCGRNVPRLVILAKDERRLSSDESDATRVECRSERIRVWHKLSHVAQRREVTCHPEH